MDYYSAIRGNEILPFATTGRQDKEVSQTEKGKYSISLICGIQNTNEQTKQK